MLKYATQLGAFSCVVVPVVAGSSPVAHPTKPQVSDMIADLETVLTGSATKIMGQNLAAWRYGCWNVAPLVPTVPFMSAVLVPPVPDERPGLRALGQTVAP